MIKFECETCFQEYKVRDDRAGNVLKCKACGEKMRVPSGGDDFEDDMYEEYEQPVRPTRKKKTSGASKKKKNTSNSNGAIIAISGVCALGIVALIVFMLVGGNKNKANDAPAPAEVAQNENLETSSDADVSNAPAETTQPKSKPVDNSASTPTQAKPKVAKKKNNSTPTSQKWVSLVDPPPVVTDWPESSKLSINLKNIDSHKIRPNTFSPFLGLRERDREVFRIDIWNLASGEKTGQVAINIDKNQSRSFSKFKLSADGKHLLYSFISRDTKIPKLESWDVGTGEKLAEWEVAPAGSSVSKHEIVGSTKALAILLSREGKKIKKMMKVWDLKTGKLINEKELSLTNFADSNYKITFGGKYFLTFNPSNKLMVYDLQSLDLIYELPLKDLLRSSNSEHAKESYYSFGGMNFSADGKELGLLLSSSEGTSIWTIDLTNGKAENSYFVPGSLREALSDPSYSGDHLLWFPDGKGWLLYGAWFVDRERKQVVWTLKTVSRVMIRDEVYLGSNYLFAETPALSRDAKGRSVFNRNPKLMTVQIPEVKIADSLAAYNSKSDAILGLGQEVSIEVNVGNLKYGNADEVKTILAEVMQKRLEADGFKVAPDQQLIFKIEYQEQDGNKLQLTKRGRSTRENPTGRTSTGQTLQTTAAAFKLSWISKKRKVTRWSKEALVNPRFLILRDATAAGAREKMFEELQNRMIAESVPYFIPKDKKLSQLPFEIKLPE